MLIGYARVSTTEQNIDLQLAALKREECDVIYQDHASGVDAERAGYLEALGKLRPGDTLVVWRLDRLARSMRELSDTIHALHAREIGFRSVCEYIDISSAYGEFVVHILSAVAHFERALIVERTRAGMAAAKARGGKFGRAPILNEEQARDAIRMVLDGQSVRAVSKQFGIGKSTLYRYLGRGRSITRKR